EKRYESVREALAALLSARRDGDVETVYGGPVPSAIARTWRETTAAAITMLRQRHAEGAITEPLEHLAWSYAHLHCNRLGLDVPAEAILRYLMFRHYEDERVAPIAGPSI